MKIKEFTFGILLLSGLFFCYGRLNGQEINYYTNNRLVINDKVYIIDSLSGPMSGSIKIWDSANIKMFTPQYYPDGEEIPFRHGHFKRLYYQDREKIKEVVRAVFSPEEIQKFKEKDASLYVEIIVDSTGHIIEQLFLISYADRILLSIPPEKLYRLEKELKEKVKFNVEEYEKQFGFTKGKVINISFKNY